MSTGSWCRAWTVSGWTTRCTLGSPKRETGRTDASNRRSASAFSWTKVWAIRCACRSRKTRWPKCRWPGRWSRPTPPALRPPGHSLRCPCGRSRDRTPGSRLGRGPSAAGRRSSSRFRSGLRSATWMLCAASATRKRGVGGPEGTRAEIVSVALDRAGDVDAAARLRAQMELVAPRVALSLRVAADVAVGLDDHGWTRLFDAADRVHVLAHGPEASDWKV